MLEKISVTKKLRNRECYAIITWFGKETGESPVRARRRKVQEKNLFYQIYMPQIWNKSLGYNADI